tara:strand:+ start:364 stop:534 length:171 start_codon:yes stop_codon:yes gene_type:complete
MENLTNAKEIRKEQIIKFTNQLQRELFASLDERNVTAARHTLAAINQVIKEEIKSK